MVKNPETGGSSHTKMYEDIMHMDYPLSSADIVRHPRMAMEDRAKIFAPFAALKGYEEAIAAKQRIIVSKAELSEEMKEELDRKLQMIEHALEKGEHPVISVIYFEQDKDGEAGEGAYIRFTGMVAGVQMTARFLQIVNRKLPLDDIRDMEGEIFGQLAV